MTILEELKARELLYDTTNFDLLNKKLEEDKLTFYLGADPTGDSLHVGHLVVYLVAKRLEEKGHNPVFLIGGATGSIGDPKPGGEREMLTMEKIGENADSLHRQVSKLFDCKMVNNYDWISKINALDFLRDYGKHFNVNYMINKDTVKSRLDSGISYTEFSYQILQALDYENLYKEHNCTLQMGGQDQWGNITAGLELIRKNHSTEENPVEAFGLTVPLITKSDGTKFGKTEGGAVWLDAEKTSPYEFYQFWINTSDEDAVKRLKQYTFLSLEEIAKIEEEFKKEPHMRLAQKTLAKEITTLIHGDDAYEQAVNISAALFSGNVSNLSENEIEMGFAGLDTIEESSINILDALVALELASSKTEAKKFIKQNSISVNGTKISEEEIILDKDNALHGKYTILRRGKKKYGFIKH